MFKFLGKSWPEVLAGHISLSRVFLDRIICGAVALQLGQVSLNNHVACQSQGFLTCFLEAQAWPGASQWPGDATSAGWGPQGRCRSLGSHSSPVREPGHSHHPGQTWSLGVWTRPKQRAGGAGGAGVSPDRPPAGGGWVSVRSWSWCQLRPSPSCCHHTKPLTDTAFAALRFD